MVELLSICANIHPLTDGFFDPSVQPVWNLYAHHFRRSPGSARGPDLDAQSRVRERIGFERVVVEAGRVELLGPGMALTLNGIAQGYISDRIAALLARAGISHALLT